MKTKVLPLINFLIFVFVCLLQMTIVIPVFSQSQKMAFADWLSTTGSQNFFHKGLTKTDASGNVYIVGSTITGSGNNDIYVVKYNSEGVQQWSHQYDSGNNLEDVGLGCYVDGSGNVYVSGTTQTSLTNSDMIIIKYNSSGTQQWLRTYNGTGSSFDSGADMYVDGSGNVYMTGSGYNANGNTDCITLKYNSSGTQQWVKYLNYNGNNDVGVKIAPYGSYVLVAVVAQYNSTSYYYGLLQYAMSNGNLANSSITGSSSTNMDVISDMVVDASGYIYIAGATPVAGQGSDYSLIKLNINLGVSWERNYNGSDSLDDQAKGVRVDASGNVYVTGYSTTSSEGKNIVTQKYNSSGTLQWTETYNDDLDGDDEAYAMAMDDAGLIYVTGYKSTEIDGTDCFTIKYDSNGDIVWTVSNDGPYHLNDKVTNIAIDDDGNVIIAASSETAPGEYQYLTVKYVEHDILIPSDYNEEEPHNSFLYYKNNGQIINTDNDAVPEIKYYNRNSYPEFYFKCNSLCIVFSSIDTNRTTNDTLHRIDVTYPKGNSNSKTYPLNQQKECHNYFLSQCPEGISHVYGNQKLIVPELFDNIDLLYSSNDNGIKYYYIIKPGGDPDDIEMVFSGSDSVKINGTNNALTIYSSVGNLALERPTAYQVDQYNNVDTINGWNCAWQAGPSSSFSFYTGSYNSSLPLIIQIDIGHLLPDVLETPGNLEWSTHFGWGNWPMREGIHDITTDDNGNVYAIGITCDEHFPTYNGENPSISTSPSDIFVAKFNANAERENITFFGGNGIDERGRILFANDQIFIAGQTNSSDLPSPQGANGYPTSFVQDDFTGGIRDAFIASMSLTDLRLNWRTYFGGYSESEEVISSICADNSGNIYIGGYVYFDGTILTDNSCSPVLNRFPLCSTGNAYYQSQYAGNYDGFFAGFNSQKELIWSTFFGGNGNDFINTIEFEPLNKRLYFAGVTTTTTISNNNCSVPTNGGLPFCTYSGGYNESNNHGANEGFIGDFIVDGGNTELEWTTFFGGNENDYITNMAINQSTDNIYITGLSNSEDFFPEENNNGAYYNQDFMGCYDAFIANFDEDNSLQWSTFVGGQTDEQAINALGIGNGTIQDIAIDEQGYIYITGATAPSTPNFTDDFPYQQLSGAYDQSVNSISESETKSYDAYIVTFDPNINQPFWATYFGGNYNQNLTPYLDDFDGDDYGVAIATSNFDKKLYLGGVSVSNSFPLVYPPNGWWEDVTPTSPIYYDTYIYSAFISRFNIDYFSFGVNENTIKGNQLLIYPNPSYDEINIEVEEINAPISNINIYSITGDLIYCNNYKNNYNNKIAINISHFNSGYYFIGVTTSSGTFNKCFIKIE